MKRMCDFLASIIIAGVTYTGCLSVVSAQSPVSVIGPVTPGDCVIFSSTTIIKDSGSGCTGGLVSSLNGLTGAVNITAGTGITVTTTAPNIIVGIDFTGTYTWTGLNTFSHASGGNSANFTGGPVLIQPTANSLTQGLYINMPTVSGTAVSGPSLNVIAIASDVAAITGANQSLVGLTFLQNFGPSSASATPDTLQGGRIGVLISTNFSAPSSALNTFHDYVGLTAQIGVIEPDGGTNTGAGAQGSFFATNFVATADPTATNLFGLVGGEVNIAAGPGSSLKYKVGWQIIELGSSRPYADAVQGTSVDAAISVTSQAGAVGWKTGISFDAHAGLYPFQAGVTGNGTIIYSSAGTIVNGIDFSVVTATGSYFLGGANFAVDLNGNTRTPIVIGGTAASSTLTLESTSGVGTTDSIIFKTGSQSTRWTINTAGDFLGAAGMVEKFQGSSSGVITIAPQAAAGTATLTLPNTAGTFAVSASAPLALSATTGALTCAGCLTANQTITLTGDVTGSGTTAITTVNVNLPTGVTVAGTLLHTNIAAPGSPASGKDIVWTDSTDLRFHDKNASGVIGTTVVASTAGSNQFATGISVAGAIAYTQPATTNLSDIATFSLNTSGTITTSNTTEASTTSAAALVTAGGLGVAKKIRAGGGIYPGVSTFSSGVAQAYTAAGYGFVLTAGTGTTYDFGFFNVVGSEIFTNPHASTDIRLVGDPAAAGNQGHLRTGLYPPTLTSCGSGSPTISGSDTAGVVTMGTSATGCIMTFVNAYTNTPYCTVTWQGTPLLSQSYTVSNTAITLTQTSTGGNKVNYTCLAQSGG